MSLPTVQTQAQIEAKLIAWLTSVLPQGVPATMEDQNAPPPVPEGGQFVTVFGLYTTPETEIDELIQDVQPDPLDVTLTTAAQYAIYMQISVHADNPNGLSAYDQAWALQRAIRRQLARDALYPLAVIAVQQVQQLPQTLQDQYENRSEFTVQLRLGVQDSDTIEVIESVGITGTLTGGKIPHNVSIEVTSPPPPPAP